MLSLCGLHLALLKDPPKAKPKLNLSLKVYSGKHLVGAAFSRQVWVEGNAFGVLMPGEEGIARLYLSFDRAREGQI